MFMYDAVVDALQVYRLRRAEEKLAQLDGYLDGIMPVPDGPTYGEIASRAHAYRREVERLTERRQDR
jgi:hypothetical protein